MATPRGLTLAAPLEELRSPAGGTSWDGRPWRRLAALLRTERSDLWALVIYSAGVGLLSLVVPVAVQSLVNTVAFGALTQPLVVLTLLVLVALGFSAVMNGFRVWVVEVIQRRIFVRVALDVTQRLLRVRPETFDRLHGPELVNRFFDVVTVQKSAAALLMDGLSLLMQTAVGMILLAVYHPLLLAFDLILVAVMLFVMFVLGRGAVRTAILESKSKYQMAEWLEELSSHLSTFKSTAGSRFAMEHSDALAGHYLDYRRAHFRIVLRQIAGSLAMQAVASAVLLGIGGLLVLERQLTIGQLVAAELIVSAVVAGFSKFGKKFETFYDLLASIDKLGQLIDLPLERGGAEILQAGGPARIELRNVSLGYHDQEPVASGLSLILNAGDRAAITGPAGAGKSTLAEMLAGLRSPLAGVVLIDGADYRDLAPDSLRDYVAFVHPNEIFTGTVRENVAVGRSDVDHAAVRDALAGVGLLDEILDLPGGLETKLTTSGRPLSPSQSARLMLARAIARRPRLLIIDDALEKIDAQEFRDHIAEMVFRPDAPWTLLCVTQRPDLLARCNRVFQLNGGVLA